jgi:hypothetical protein
MAMQNTKRTSSPPMTGSRDISQEWRLIFTHLQNKNRLATFIHRSQNAVAGDSMTQAYCVKCKAKREMKDSKNTTMKNGKKAVTGVCPVCGTKMFRIGG